MRFSLVFLILVACLSAMGCAGLDGYVTNSILICNTVIKDGKQLSSIPLDFEVAYNGSFVTFEEGDWYESDDETLSGEDIGAATLYRPNTALLEGQPTCFQLETGQNYYKLDSIAVSILDATLYGVNTDGTTKTTRIKGTPTSASILQTNTEETTSDYTRVSIRVDVTYDFDNPNTNSAPIKIDNLLPYSAE